MHDGQPALKDLTEDLLNKYSTLDEFLAGSPRSAAFWFFQRRGAFMSQYRCRKWSSKALDDYVVTPAAPAESYLTCSGGIPKTPDIESFLQHIDEVLGKGVQETLKKYHYHCYEDHDRQYLTPWLELLDLLRQLKLDIDFDRTIMDHMTCQSGAGLVFYPVLGLNRFEGSLVHLGEKHT
ncbi:hypothetical protein IG631_16964 [Alternaria alternata]|nr:hypothetical protein IG631_16964 [Alternaria alternata]